MVELGEDTDPARCSDISYASLHVCQCNGSCDCSGCTVAVKSNRAAHLVGEEPDMEGAMGWTRLPFSALWYPYDSRCKRL
jgi:ferredoxin